MIPYCFAGFAVLGVLSRVYQRKCKAWPDVLLIVVLCPVVISPVYTTRPTSVLTCCNVSVCREEKILKVWRPTQAVAPERLLLHLVCLCELWSSLLLDKIRDAQLIKQLPAFRGTRKFNYMFTRARQQSLN
jgi:hypothetical protein